MQLFNKNTVQSHEKEWSSILFSAIENDERLTAWHVAILIVIIAMALRQGRIEASKVSRRRIMALSYITTLPTYYKYFKDFQELGYFVTGHLTVQ